jgi:hypothetical protein
MEIDKKKEFSVFWHPETIRPWWIEFTTSAKGGLCAGLFR